MQINPLDGSILGGGQHRPDGRAMPAPDLHAQIAAMFQSAPGLTAGRCNAARYTGRHTLVSIRARPDGRAMHCIRQRIRGGVVVSIRARPDGRAMHETFDAALNFASVSIRARPDGRAMLRDRCPITSP